MKASNDLTEIKSGWTWGLLGDAASLVRRWTQLEDDVSYKRVTVQLHGRGIGLRDEVTGREVRTKKQQIIRGGDLLVAEIDAKMGAFGLVPSSLDGAVVSSHYFTFEVNPDVLDPGYLSLLITVGYLTHQIQSDVRGSLNYAAIRPHHVLAIAIPLPTLLEQKELAHRAEIARAAKQVALEQMQALDDFPKVLFHHAFRQATLDATGPANEKVQEAESVRTAGR